MLFADTYIIQFSLCSHLESLSNDKILISSHSIGFHTDHFLGLSNGLIVITGLHSVIQYHSMICALLEFNLLNCSNTDSGHFSAHTTAYFKDFKSFDQAWSIIILRKVGVAAKAVASVCLISSTIVLESFGSGVYATFIHVISGIIVFTVNPKL